MKKLQMIFLMVSVCVFSTTLTTMAGDYLGTYCWRTTDTTIKLAITDAGDGQHYDATGTIYEDTGDVFPVNGSFSIIGNTLQGVFTFAEYDGQYFDDGIIRTDMSLGTLSGDYIGTFRVNDGSSISTFVDSGPCTFIPCP